MDQILLKHQSNLEKKKQVYSSRVKMGLFIVKLEGYRKAKPIEHAFSRRIYVTLGVFFMNVI